ncbi:hypothetical protein FRACYDRAFT_269658 [Fragilariopsis cylindrus CCMP1102]|uniref:Uncharacterized protein n=1 Tax=Fragilariopsis cylindrus CCMP1102 TaxID=635003 RepID=A0A1E7F998_9STRA|nr:hypothetical protein FRACYDRAFT_269658 [Fragilariopsis cylindrus CCMP1102]|eukprot:OEU14742.1 hypothetical protein FRACYDRAFT_269658 [Fragilariopsis cylindrus CCMP1102]
MKFITIIFFLSALCCSVANAFSSSSSSTQVATSLLPTFDKKTQRWSPAEGSEEEPYGLGRTLLGNGPVPAITRITQSDDYMQAVLKFQANEKSTIRYAQGNMDAYFENPNDWAYQRTSEDRGGYKKKYGEPLDKKSVLLTVVWGVGISAFIVNFGYTLVTGRVCDGNAEMQFCKVFFK